MKTILSTWLFLVFAATTGVLASEAVPAYEMTVEGDRVSLRVTNGSVAELARDLGRRLGFEVIADGVEDARVTLDFSDLTPSQAIREICEPVGYLEVPDLRTGRTVRLVLTSRGGGSKNRAEARREPLPARPQPAPEPTGTPAQPEPGSSGKKRAERGDKERPD